MDKRLDAFLLVNRIGVAMLFIWAVFASMNAAFGSWSATIAAVPTISQITPVSCVVSWPVYPQYDDSTHYQVRLNGALYGSSTKGTSQKVIAQRPGYTSTIDYVIYHKGKVLGVSSATQVLQCPATPVGVYADTITSTSFRLSWGDVPTAEEYLIIIDGYPSQTVTAPAHQVLLDGFLPGVLLNVRVRARNASGYSYDSKPLTVQLLPPAPLQISVSEIGQTSFRLSWLAATGAASYTVFRDTETVVEVGSSTLTYVVASCTPGASHTVRLQSRNANGLSDLSTETRVLMIPATPLRPMTLAVSSQSFTISWIPVLGAQGYKIWRDTEWQIGNVSSQTTTATFKKGFDPGNAASITVSAYNQTGDSPQSPGVYVVLTDASGTASLTVWLLPDDMEIAAWKPGSQLTPVLARIEDASAANHESRRPGPMALVVWNPERSAEQGKMLRLCTDLDADVGRVGVKIQPAVSKSVRESQLFLIDQRRVVVAVYAITNAQTARQEILRAFGLQLPPPLIGPELMREYRHFEELHRLGQ
ncbi:MAG TPA: fibronectin type III domain-containing protein [Candidatus Ozemobacteraceae bacterium]|nr:fibronectin type III domain-containing protein [Candidatus Ozemobacteraceae bacterium]